MKAKVIYFKAFIKNEFENRVAAQVRYNGKNYVCSVSCWHWFDGKDYIVNKINDFSYLTTVARQSKTGDYAIKEAMKRIKYTL